MNYRINSLYKKIKNQVFTASWNDCIKIDIKLLRLSKPLFLYIFTVSLEKMRVIVVSHNSRNHNWLQQQNQNIGFLRDKGYDLYWENTNEFTFQILMIFMIEYMKFNLQAVDSSWTDSMLTWLKISYDSALLTWRLTTSCHIPFLL